MKVSDAPWSEWSRGDYTDEQWRRACILDHEAGSTAKERYGLPVREPDGTLNRNGVHAAAARLAGGGGGVHAPVDGPSSRRSGARHALLGDGRDTARLDRAPRRLGVSRPPRARGVSSSSVGSPSPAVPTSTALACTVRSCTCAARSCDVLGSSRPRRPSRPPEPTTISAASISSAVSTTPSQTREATTLRGSASNQPPCPGSALGCNPERRLVVYRLEVADPRSAGRKLQALLAGHGRSRHRRRQLSSTRGGRRPASTAHRDSFGAVVTDQDGAFGHGPPPPVGAQLAVKGQAPGRSGRLPCGSWRAIYAATTLCSRSDAASLSSSSWVSEVWSTVPPYLLRSSSTLSGVALRTTAMSAELPGCTSEPTSFLNF